MNRVTDVQQDQARLSSRVEELRQEIKMRIANKASAEVTFDKVIECFTALINLAKAISLTSRNWADPMWRWRRNETLDKLLELLDAVEPSTPLRAQMVAQGRDWLSEFDDYKLWRDVMAYCYISRFRQELVEIRHNTLQFSDEVLQKFAQENPEAIEHAFINGMLPEEGKLLRYPLAQEGAQDHWDYMYKLLQFTTNEKDATPQPAELFSQGT